MVLILFPPLHSVFPRGRFQSLVQFPPGIFVEEHRQLAHQPFDRARSFVTPRHGIAGVVDLHRGDVPHVVTVQQSLVLVDVDEPDPHRAVEDFCGVLEAGSKFLAVGTRGGVELNEPGVVAAGDELVEVPRG